jgi:hypothetical protein
MVYKLLFVAVLISSPIFATNFSFGHSIEVSSAHQLNALILENQDYCLEKVVDEKVYLKPKKIFITNSGVFLRITHWYLVRLPTLLSDEEGCYITFIE